MANPGKVLKIVIIVLFLVLVGLLLFLNTFSSESVSIDREVLTGSIQSSSLKGGNSFNSINASFLSLKKIRQGGFPYFWIPKNLKYLDFEFKPSFNKNPVTIRIRASDPPVLFSAGREGLGDELVVGEVYSVSFIFVDPKSSLVTKSLVENLCKSNESCKKAIGSVGDNKISANQIQNIFSGNAGKFVDLSQSALIINIVNVKNLQR